MSDFDVCVWKIIGVLEQCTLAVKCTDVRHCHGDSHLFDGRAMGCEVEARQGRLRNLILNYVGNGYLGATRTI